MSKTPTVFIGVILLGSLNSACNYPHKHPHIKNCHVHTDNQGHKVAKHCHANNNKLKHEHPYRYRNL